MKKKKSIAEIIEYGLDDRHHKITVLPFMCGAGKSTAISELIVKAIQQERRLLIITDRIYRFDQYLNPKNDETYRFIQNHKRKSISVLTAGNAGNAAKYAMKRPVLMMTAQRFL